MFAFKAGLALAAACVFLSTAPVQAADLDYAYNDPSCMTASDYASLSGSGLSSAVGADVAANPSCGYDACSAAGGLSASPVSSNASARVVVTPVSSDAQAIGTGLGQAYSHFASSGDQASAGVVASAACGCSGGVAVAFSSVVGVPVSSVCSASWSLGGYAGVKPYLWRLLATGGGNGVSRN